MQARRDLHDLASAGRGRPGSGDLGEQHGVGVIARAEGEVTVSVKEAGQVLGFALGWILRWEAVNTTFDPGRVRRHRASLRPPTTSTPEPGARLDPSHCSLIVQPSSRCRSPPISLHVKPPRPTRSPSLRRYAIHFPTPSDCQRSCICVAKARACACVQAPAYQKATSEPLCRSTRSSACSEATGIRASRSVMTSTTISVTPRPGRAARPGR